MRLITAQCLGNISSSLNALLQFQQSPLDINDKEYNKFPLDSRLKEKKRQNWQGGIAE